MTIYKQIKTSIAIRDQLAKDKAKNAKGEKTSTEIVRDEQ